MARYSFPLNFEPQWQGLFGEPKHIQLTPRSALEVMCAEFERDVGTLITGLSLGQLQEISRGELGYGCEADYGTMTYTAYDMVNAEIRRREHILKYTPEYLTQQAELKARLDALVDEVIPPDFD